jgi:putative ABC transport system permease protein
MFIRVKQRSREIGIEMALGAKPRWILSRFLVDAMFLVACGGATGFLSAWVTVKLAAKLPITEQVGIPNVPLGLALGMVFLIGFIGILAGFFPARRAAQIDPVRVLNDQ